VNVVHDRKGTIVRRFSGVALGVGVAALLLAALGAYALASSGGATITVCVEHEGGALYSAKKCARHDRKLSWNRQGPAGPAGQSGPAGPQGAQGREGDQGRQGTQGPPGMSDYQVVSGTPVLSSGGGINLDSAYAYCPPGTSVLGGGFSSSGADNTIYVRADQPVDQSPGEWYVQTTSASETVYTITPYAVCAAVSK